MSSLTVYLPLSKHDVLTPEKHKKIIKHIQSNTRGAIKRDTKIVVGDSSFRTMFPVLIIHGDDIAILDPLGKGAYGMVFRGYNITKDKYLAVKKQSIVHRELAHTQAAITRTSAIGLTDPQLNTRPTIIGNNIYFTMPLAETNFLNFLNKGNFNDAVIMETLKSIFQEVQDLHNRGSVHMDIKPDNILVIDNFGYLADYGKCAIRGNLIDKACGNFLDYPHCAPEYFTFRNAINQKYLVSSKFDIYSLGKLLQYVSKYIVAPKRRNDLINLSLKMVDLMPDMRITMKDAIFSMNMI